MKDATATTMLQTKTRQCQRKQPRIFFWKGTCSRREGDKPEQGNVLDKDGIRVALKCLRHGAADSCPGHVFRLGALGDSIAVTFAYVARLEQGQDMRIGNWRRICAVFLQVNKARHPEGWGQTPVIGGGGSSSSVEPGINTWTGGLEGPKQRKNQAGCRRERERENKRKGRVASHSNVMD